MVLYIKVVDGEVEGYPILESNLSEVVDNFKKNPTSLYRVYKKTDMPNLTPYQVFVRTELDIFDDVVQERHIVRDMTSTEKEAKIQDCHDVWKSGDNFASWTFNEDTCQYDPPVAKPIDDKSYVWDNSTSSWTEVE